MQQWEYFICNYFNNDVVDKDALHYMGADGWELSAVVGTRWVFKRPIGPDWKARCEAAEAYISESPCDPDITAAQLKAYNKWQEIKNKQ